MSRRNRRQQEQFNETIISSMNRNQLISQHFNSGNLSNLVRQRESDQSRRSRNRNRRAFQGSIQRSNVRGSSNSIHGSINSILVAMSHSYTYYKTSGNPNPVMPELETVEKNIKRDINEKVDYQFENPLACSRS